MKKRYLLPKHSLVALMLVFAMIFPCFTQVAASGTAWTVSDETQVFWVFLQVYIRLQK